MCVCLVYTSHWQLSPLMHRTRHWIWPLLTSLMSSFVTLSVRFLGYQQGPSWCFTSTSLCSTAPPLVTYHLNGRLCKCWSWYFSIENMQWPRTSEGPARRLYFLGFIANLKQVFGNSCLLALLPVASRWVDYLHNFMIWWVYYACWVFVLCRECDGVHFTTQRRNIELGSFTGQRLPPEEGTEAENDQLLDSEEQPLTSSVPL